MVRMWIRCHCERRRARPLFRQGCGLQRLQAQARYV